MAQPNMLQKQKQHQLRRKRMALFIIILIGLRQWSKTIKQPYNDSILTGDAYDLLR
ncbi:hypothetical protein PtA15_4A358 [Puccinia triticina]|uniref:Uncharacterized protein n=1 Tax=Puccinia triticina TaxID=208348 RepID=A0ABY7CHT9_9BASI|nr:uncharacterized protein PtA15_4A358 [Puccinia triticina]WAQ83908.1 hypothetical protein PtA15_4A358 [Puccinia triticina]